METASLMLLKNSTVGWIKKLRFFCVKAWGSINWGMKRKGEKKSRAISKSDLDTYHHSSLGSQTQENGGGRFTFLSSPAHVELLHSSFLLLLFPFPSSWFPFWLQRDSLEARPACWCNFWLQQEVAVLEDDVKIVYCYFHSFFPLYTSHITKIKFIMLPARQRLWKK